MVRSRSAGLVVLVAIGLAAVGAALFRPEAERPPGAGAPRATADPLGPVLKGRGNGLSANGGPTAPTALAATDSTPAKTVRVAVRIDNGTALAGVLVRLHGAEPPYTWLLDARTDAAGFAVFLNAPPGPYRIHALGTGYVIASQPWDCNEAYADEYPTLDLEPGLPFDGRVVDAETGRPIGGASVMLWHWGDGVEVGPTNEEGAFYVPGIEDGEQTELVARAPGYATLNYRVVADSGRVHPASPVLRLVAGGALAGVVQSPEGAPVADARVRVKPHRDDAPTEQSLDDHVLNFLYGDWVVDSHDDETVVIVKSDADGRFQVDGLAFGTRYEVNARAGSFVEAAAPVQVVVTADQPVASLQLSLRRAGLVRLHVETPDDETLPNDARVRVFERHRCHTPAGPPQKGVFHFRDVAPGLVHGFVEAEGYLATAVPIDVPVGDEVEAVLRLERGAAVEGFVYAAHGKPAGGAKVSAALAAWNRDREMGSYLAGDRETTADAEGHFRIEGLPPGEVYLVAVGTRRSPGTSGRVLAHAPASGVLLKLHRGGGYRVRLLLPSGEPFAGRLMAMEYSQSGWGGFSGNIEVSDGRFEQDSNHRDGTYEIVLTPQGYVWIRRELTVAESSVTDWGDVVLDPGVTVSGQVVDDRGTPVAEVEICCDDNTERLCRTDLEGRFAMDHFPNGGFRLNAWAERHVHVGIEVKRGATTGLRIVLPRAAIVKGAARRADGSPVGNGVFEFRVPGATVKSTDEEPQADGTTKRVEYFADSHDLWLDPSGRFDNAVAPGTYIAIFTDAAGKEQRVGEFRFDAEMDYEIELVLPAN